MIKWVNKKLNNYAANFNPGIVDIMPTLARHLQISIPDNTDKEIDGVPLIGDLSIYLATTNSIKEGTPDQYTLLTTVPSAANHTTIDITNYPSRFYKVALVGKYNQVNKWFVIGDSKQ